MRVNARKCEEDGIVFDSGHERDVYRELKLRQRVGEISKLQVHVLFKFVVQGVPICTMKPDFTYHDAWGRVHVVDAKGFKQSRKTGKMLPRVNREFGIKKRLMLACFGLEVEVA